MISAIFPNSMRHAFRLHETLALRLALKEPLLSIFAMGFVLFPWFLLSCLSFTFYSVIFPSAFTGEQSWWAAVTLPLMCLVAVVTVLAWTAWAIPWFWMCLQLMLGKKEPARSREIWLTSHLLRQKND